MKILLYIIAAASAVIVLLAAPRKLSGPASPPSPGSAQATLINVPFTVQAPDGNWKNPVFQHGCEETSTVMAMDWAFGKPLTSANAGQQITDLTNFEIQKQGAFYWNISAEDLTQLIKNYYPGANVSLATDITTSDIKNELSKGNIAIIYTDGQKLFNPYYSRGGSAYHTLVVKGFDPAKDEFITNDSGTIHGNGFRYPESVINNALRDYPTGPYQPVAVVHKDMIIVRRT